MVQRDKNSIDIGQQMIVNVQVTDKMVRQFAEMSGDFNPIHLDEEYAKTTRFGRRIAHGMITGALISRALTETLGEGGVYLAQTMKFVGPVFIDDTVVITMTITALRRERGICSVDTTITKTTGETVLKGDATIMFAWGLDKK